MLLDTFKNLEKFTGIIFFIEAKLYKDKLKENQEKLRKYLIQVSERNPFCFYILATETNYKYIYELILTGKYLELKTLNK